MKYCLTFCILFIHLNLIANTGYYRFPNVHQDTLVFTAEGDLWVATLNDLKAKRLTTHPSEEKEAMISPDGRFVAFTATYEGAREVYIMPIQGGVARRISHENSRVRLQGWTPEQQIIYSTDNFIGAGNNWVLRQVDPVSLQVKTFPLMDAVEGLTDSQGNHLYFIQFGLQLTNDHTKMYRGGAKGELWRFSLKNNQEATRLTQKHIGSVKEPMPYKNNIYFLSDQSGSFNIWKMDKSGNHQEQVTHYKDFSIISASHDQGKVVYQLGADIKLLDLDTGKSQVLPIELVSDFAHLRKRWFNSPLNYLSSARLAPKDDKLVLTSRGRVAIASTDDSRMVDIATPLDSRTRYATLSHDGKWIYALNDASGATEIWRFAADGSRDAKQLTFDSDAFRWYFYPSPDGKWIAHDDKNGDLWLLNVKSGKNKKIFSKGASRSGFSDVEWSLDSQRIALSVDPQGADRNQIVIYDLKKQKSVVLTDPAYHSYAPTFSEDGEWLYFLSNRFFRSKPGSPWGDRNTGAYFERRTQIFAYALKEDITFPFQSKNELMQDKISDDEEDEEKKKVQLESINQQLWKVPVVSGNYRNLSVNNNYLFVMDYVGGTQRKSVIKKIELKPTAKVSVFTEGVRWYQLSNSRKKMLVQKDGSNNQFYLVSANKGFPSKTNNTRFKTSQWKIAIDPKKEWQQMFQDTWYMHKAFFFEPNMRGVDWEVIQKRYFPLLDRVTDRYELSDLFAQMISELNVLHSQVYSSDHPRDASQPQVAALGAVYQQTDKGILIQHIYQHDPELPDRISPLASPYVDVKVGDRIQSINGVKVNSIAHLHQQLLNQANKQVLLELKRKNKSFKVIVEPVSRQYERQLRYLDWVNSRKAFVKQSQSNIGYLHLNAMVGGNMATFVRDFYAQYHMDGLIIDVRRNRGGSIDSWLIEKLLRKAWSFWKPPIGKGYTNMQQTFRGHLVVLTDEMTYSNGETFAAAVKALKLGTVIGKKTAGAGVWLTGRNRVVDNGLSRAAELPVYDMSGEWMIEGRGVEPDIRVDNLPFTTFNGQDKQLEEAIKFLQNKIQMEPIPELKVR